MHASQERFHSALLTAALMWQVLGHSLAMVMLPCDAMWNMEVYLKQEGKRPNCNCICCDLAALQGLFEVSEQR